MMHRVPGTRCLSTPKALTTLACAYSRGEITMDQHSMLVKCCVQLLCKKEPESKHKRVFIKLPFMCSGQMALIHKAFPHGTFKLIFNARHPEPCLKSFLKVANNMGASIAFHTGDWWRCHWEDMPRPYE